MENVFNFDEFILERSDPKVGTGKKPKGKEIPDGFYKGTIQGYGVSIEDIECEFEVTTGFRNAIPIPCHIYVNDGHAVVFTKHGMKFSDNESENKWKSNFENREDDPRYLEEMGG